VANPGDRIGDVRVLWPLHRLGSSGSGLRYERQCLHTLDCHDRCSLRMEVVVVSGHNNVPVLRPLHRLGGHVHVLWNHTPDSEASIFNVVLGSSFTSQAYGPFNGWQAQHLAVGSDNLARMLWDNTSTKQASVFTVASDGSVTSSAYGPISGWQAIAIAQGP